MMIFKSTIHHYLFQKRIVKPWRILGKQENDVLHTKVALSDYKSYGLEFTTPSLTGPNFTALSSSDLLLILIVTSFMIKINRNSSLFITYHLLKYLSAPPLKHHLLPPNNRLPLNSYNTLSVFRISIILPVGLFSSLYICIRYT